MVDTAVTDMGCRASSTVETEQGHCSACLSESIVVLGVKNSIGIFQSSLQLFVSQDFPWKDVLLEVGGQSLADSRTGNFASFVSSHTVAEYEKGIVCRGFSELWIQAILLIGSLSHLIDGLWRVKFYLHILLLFKIYKCCISHLQAHSICKNQFVSIQELLTTYKGGMFVFVIANEGFQAAIGHTCHFNG